MTYFNLISPWVYDTLFHSKLWPTHHLVLADSYTVMISSDTVYAAAKPNINTRSVYEDVRMYWTYRLFTLVIS